MGCDFCMTGKQGFNGQLSAGDILNQIKSLPERDTLTNIVYMGMGEPLDNLEEVLKSLEVLTSEWGFGMSPRRITVSTIGILEPLKLLLEKSNCNIAISLHTPFEEERQKIMPVQKANPVKQIIEFLKTIDTGRKKISFEYIMFRDFNDTSKHVNELSRLLHGLKCRINLIKFHNIPGSSLEGSGDDKIEEFMTKLKNKGITTTIRRSRGEDIAAACGMLSTKASN
jgi:23S rRNA (adenine2503-C2)-methyltransferase